MQRPKSAIGIFGYVIILADALRLLAQIPAIRRLLVMTEFGQAIDFIIEHWSSLGWLANVYVQLAIVVVGLALILWDRERPAWLPSPDLSPRKMIIVGLFIVATGAIVIAIGVWQISGVAAPSSPPTATPPQTTATAPPPPLPVISYNERQLRELIDATAEAEELIQRKLMPVSEPIQNVLINPQYFLTQEGIQKTLAALENGKDRLQTEVWPSINDFVYKKHAAYEAEMRMALRLDQEAAKGELTRAIQNVIDKVSYYPPEPDKITQKSVELVRKDFEEAARQGQMFRHWLMEAASRSRSMSSNLRTRGVTGYEARQ